MNQELKKYGACPELALNAVATSVFSTWIGGRFALPSTQIKSVNIDVTVDRITVERSMSDANQYEVRCEYLPKEKLWQSRWQSRPAFAATFTILVPRFYSWQMLSLSMRAELFEGNAKLEIDPEFAAQYDVSEQPKPAKTHMVIPDPDSPIFDTSFL